MILRALRAYSVGVLNPGLEVTDLRDGITVVHGPNEAGKSTLLRALTYALYQRHKLGGDEIERDILPVGTSLAPRVEVEFEKNGDRWRIEKTFLKRRSAVLSRFEGREFVPKFDGDAADDELKRVLDSEYAGRGKGKGEHRGIGEVLICDQEALRSVHALGDRARASLRGVLGSVSTTPAARGLTATVLRCRENLFTSKGDVRDTSVLATAKAALAALELPLATLDQERTEILALERRIEENSGGEADSVERRRQLREALRDAEEDDRRRCTLAERAQGKNRELEFAKEQLKHAEGREHDLRIATDQLTAIVTKIEVTQKDVEAAALVLTRERNQLVETEKDEEALRAGREELDNAVRVAEDVLKATQARARLDELEPRLKSYRSALKAEAELQAKLASQVRPSQDEFDAISGICVERDKARDVLSSLGLRLRIEAHTALGLRGPDGAAKLKTGETIDIQGTSPLRVEIKGVAKIEARAPEGKDLAKLQATIRELERDLLEATDGFGTSDLQELKKLLAERTLLETQIAQYASRRQGLFSSESAFAKSDKEYTECGAEFATILKRHPTLSDEMPTVGQAQRHAKDAGRSKDERDARIGAAQADIAKTRKRVDSAVAEHQERLGDVRKLEAERAGLEATHDALGGAAPAVDRDGELARLRSGAVLLTDELSGIGKELAPLREAERALERVNRELAELVQLEDARKQARSQNEGKLSLLRGRGLYSEQARIEERRAQLEQQVAREQLDAEAIRLLAQLFDEEERRSVDAIIAPVAEKVRRMATAVLRREVRISFDENLFTTGVEIAGQIFSLPQLSAGTQDQFAILTRIAFAEVYSERFGRHALVLDDPLANSDAKRRRRMLDVLARAADKLQILIFTCREEDYLGLDAHRVAIDSALNG